VFAWRRVIMSVAQMGEHLIRKHLGSAASIGCLHRGQCIETAMAPSWLTLRSSTPHMAPLCVNARRREAF